MVEEMKEASVAAIPPHTQPRIRHEGYFYTCIVFCVENTLYRIPKGSLENLSEVFGDMFLVGGEGSEGQGQSEENPIVLEGYKSKDFDSLLKVILPRASDMLDSRATESMSKAEWLGVLRLSTIWHIRKVRDLAIQKLSAMNLSSTEKILFAREHRAAFWFTEGVINMATDLKCGETPIEEVASAIGWETTARVSWLQRCLDSSSGSCIYHSTASLCRTCGYSRTHPHHTKWCRHLFPEDPAKGSSESGRIPATSIVQKIFAHELALLATY